MGRFQSLAKHRSRYGKQDRSTLGDIENHPFQGLGKPEPLRYHLRGYWSRRITDEHRLIYKVSGTGDEQECLIIQCRFHY